MILIIKEEGLSTSHIIKKIKALRILPILFTKITNKNITESKEYLEVHFFHVKPLSVTDDLEKIILDTDVLGIFDVWNEYRNYICK